MFHCARVPGPSRENHEFPTKHTLQWLASSRELLDPCVPPLGPQLRRAFPKLSLLSLCPATAGATEWENGPRENDTFLQALPFCFPELQTSDKSRDSKQ